MPNKGNQTGANPKIRSSDMGMLMVTSKELALADPDSPEVNKKNLRAIEADEIKRMAVKKGASRYADIISNEIAIYGKNDVKNETCVDLDDCKAVMERTKEYFEACAAAAIPASVLSYCSVALGLSQQRVNEYIRKHNNDTTAFITRVKEMIVDQLTTGALLGYLDNVMSIFQLKNLHGFADNVRIEAAMPEQAPEIDEDALKAEYMKYAKDNGIDLSENG